ncbi:MAG TPA: hypothetical protein VIQ00_08935 [Chitinophagaceae bacterium]
MKLTNEEIAKVFAMYLDCDVEYDKSSWILEGVRALSNNFNDAQNIYLSKRIVPESDRAFVNMHKCKLLLTLLSFITDEHAIEVANLFCKMSGDGIGTLTHCVRTVDEVRRDDPWKVTIKYDTGESLSLFTDTGEVVFHTKFTEQIFLLGKYTYEPRELLIKNRYAVPLFFGVDHWANGKTAIELKIAKTP